MYEDPVLEFINRRFKVDCNWLYGNCYYFALILAKRFGGIICYDKVPGHFVTLIYDTYYDYNGVRKSTGTEVSMDYLRVNDTELYFRLIRDCMD